MTANDKEHAHETVMLEEAVDALVTDRDGLYLDATFGRGGHSRGILKQLGASGRLIALDRDPEAIKSAQHMVKEDHRFRVQQSDFSQLENWLDGEHVSGVLMDLGVSSPQLDRAERGFSFQNDGPLDMRMNPDSGISAANWIANTGEADMAAVLREYGEERFARRIASAICRHRAEQAITRTGELSDIVRAAIPAWEKGKHPATRSFQAIRIAVNDELGELRLALEHAYRALHITGRLVVISFHSLEDRIVKRFLRQKANPKQPPKRLPVPSEPPSMRLIGKPVKATPAEVQRNPRSRSAVLRVAEKLL